ncbi:carboxylesterase/lipase family protein [Glaciecola sp. 1036]|uniref:carboxylesterase/lipase family protein n=1 Tax=Alteromonadaceae TaxID=72275 RepID=UPI003D01A619
MSILKRFCLLPVILILIISISLGAECVEVAIENGIVVGEKKSMVASFKGIPYAQPPVGEKRWQPPTAIEKFSAPIDATSFGSSCPQRNQLFHSEDCLFINVFTNSNFTKKDEKPVLVWIHGGGYVSGSGDLNDQVIEHWVNQDLVLVSFNYRLGALGILSHPKIDSGAGANYSLMDMVAALNWIQTNIGKFGGDADRVTIAGGSAGGMAIQMLMVTPKSQGLFHRAIAQSGYGTWPFPRTPAVPALPESANAHVLANDLIQQATDKSINDLSVAELKAISPSALVNAISGFHLPVIDGVTLAEEPGVLFLLGKQHAVPYISGGNSYDGSVYPYSGVQPARMEALLGQQLEQVRSAYGLANPSVKSLSYQHLFGDLRYVLAGMITTSAMQNSSAAGYRYFYSISPQDAPGAGHGNEVGAIFYPAKNRSQQIMQSYWRNFIETGNPNGKGLPVWEQVSSDDENWLIIGNQIEQAKTVREEKLSLLKQSYLQRVKAVLQ